MIHSSFNYQSSSIAAGRFPPWASGVRDGIPYYSEPRVCYPPLLLTPLFVVAGKLSSLVIQWYFILHYLLAGFFIYLFLRENKLKAWSNLTGMIVFVFSGFLSLHIIHGPMGHAFLWHLLVDRMDLSVGAAL